MRRLSVEERFSRHIPEGEGCLEWIGARLPNGYGYFGLHAGELPGLRETEYAHRVAWVLHTGEAIPEGYYVCHSCDNPPCIRFEHLFLGTSKDNREDCSQKGRDRHHRPNPKVRGADHWTRRIPERIATGDRNGSRTHPERMPRGDGHVNTRLADAVVDEIKRLYAAKEYNQYELAAMFGTTQGNVSAIVNGKKRRRP